MGKSRCAATPFLLLTSVLVHCSSSALTVSDSGVYDRVTVTIDSAAGDNLPRDQCEMVIDNLEVRKENAFAKKAKL